MRVNQQSIGQQSGHSRPKEAYTLVEVLAAILIASIAASVLFVGFDNGFAILRTTREDLRATQILMQKTEAFRLYTWSDLSKAPTTFTNNYNPGGSTNLGTLYFGKVSIGPATNIANSVTYKSDLQLITITVNWTNYVDKRSVGHMRQMQTLSARSGMQNYLFYGNSTNN